MVLVLFAVLAWQFIGYGRDLHASGTVTPTLQLPVFWAPWFLSVCCGCVILVKIYHLTRPGRTMINP